MSFCYAKRLLPIDVAQEDDEFLTAVAATGVTSAAAVRQGSRHTLEHLVAHLVPKVVVHQLEVVDVDEQDGEGHARVQFVLNGRLQRAAPKRTRQSIRLVARAEIVAFPAKPNDCVAVALVAKLHAQTSSQFLAIFGFYRANVVGPTQ
jgi:hypothetical protein